MRHTDTHAQNTQAIRQWLHSESCVSSVSNVMFIFLGDVLLFVLFLFFFTDLHPIHYATFTPGSCTAISLVLVAAEQRYKQGVKCLAPGRFSVSCWGRGEHVGHLLSQPRFLRRPGSQPGGCPFICLLVKTGTSVSPWKHPVSLRKPVRTASSILICSCTKLSLISSMKVEDQHFLFCIIQGAEYTIQYTYNTQSAKGKKPANSIKKIYYFPW